MSKRTSFGRQKIAIAKITNKNSRHVTFSKRRTGLFKKASELCTLCGAEIAILVFSPSNKVFSFGHPDVDSIIDRFHGGSDGRSSESISSLKMFEAYNREDNIRMLNAMLAQLRDQLEQESHHGKEMDRARKARQGQCWWESPIGELNLNEMNQLEFSLLELKKNVEMRTSELMAADQANLVPRLVVNGGRDAEEIELKYDADQDNNNGGAGAFSQLLNGLFSSL